MKFDYTRLQESNDEELALQYNLLHEYRKHNPIIEFNKWDTSRHHFIPKSMGGDNSKTNYIRITNEEHFIAHYILHRLHGGKMTSAFNLLCGGLIGLDSKNSLDNLEEIKNLFESESLTIRQTLSESMRGDKNPSFGLFGKSHPTSSFDKSGCNNPRFGIVCPENVKNAVSISNKGKVSARDIRTNEVVWIDKTLYDADENFVGVTSNTSQPKLKNTVCCLDIKDKKFVRVSKEEYKENPDRYFGLGSKVVKKFKESNNV